MDEPDLLSDSEYWLYLEGDANLEFHLKLKFLGWAKIDIFAVYILSIRVNQSIKILLWLEKKIA